jgi:hypothetical protein
MKKEISFLIPLLLLTIIIGGIVFFVKPASSLAQTYYKSINCPTPGNGKPMLQLVPCTPSGVVLPSPSLASSSVQNPAATPASSAIQSGPVCAPDSTIANGAACKCQSDLYPDAVCTTPSYTTCVANGGQPADFVDFTTGFLNPVSSRSGPTQCIWEETASVPAAAKATNCSIECNSKPVLYFYSPQTLSINVSLDIPGVVTASIPHYPANGWQNVTVHPAGTSDGTLLYNNKIYNELYYEDATIKTQPPTQGFVIKTSELKPSLLSYTLKLGLNSSEQNEFIAYWVPRLTSLKTPYIFFTVFDQRQKEKVDHVIISPAPTTTIAFLAYFKPLNAPITVVPLQFPSVPKRQGFTMVEWGGTIENN